MSPTDRSQSTNDVEKRWNDPGAVRRAVLYVGSVIATAGVWLLMFLVAEPSSVAWALGVTVILLAGGIGAFVQTYRVYRDGGSWPIWQGAGWFLFALMLGSLGLAT